MNVDIAPLESRPGRSTNRRLRCPACRRWATKLLIVARGRLLCSRCHRRFADGARSPYTACSDE